MGKYSIKELEKLSGIKAHTIRIWEKRHQLIEPSRTQTNIRFYSDDDLKKIINVSVLNSNGIKISKIVKLSLDQINKQVVELSEQKNSIDIYIEQLIVAMIDMEEERFEQILGSLILKFGFERTYIEIIYPFLEKIGVLWLSDNITPAQEHFISHLIRQKLIVAIDALPLAPKTAKRAVIYLPENELHELGLLFYHYIAKNMGLRTYYLGQTVPHKSLISVFHDHKPQIIITSLTAGPKPSEMPKYLDRLVQDLPNAKIFVSGYALKKANVTPPAGINIFSNALEFKSLIANEMIMFNN
jgi:MerR family transcriptional regulator, light-induced transcriptional regulator